MSAVDLTRRPRTKRAFSEEDMVRMRDLYYDRDRPVIEVADAFGVLVSTFLRWIAEMGWPRRTSSGPGTGRQVMDYALASNPPTPDPSPRGGGGRSVDWERAGPNIHDEAFAIEVASAARRELAALGDLAGPVDKNLSLEARERRAALIANLSRAIARIDRVFELRTERKALKLRVKQLEEELEAARNADIHALVDQTAKAIYKKFADLKSNRNAKSACASRYANTIDNGSIAASSRHESGASRKEKGAAYFCDASKTRVSEPAQ